MIMAVSDGPNWKDHAFRGIDESRVTFSRTLLVCALLLATLFVIVTLMSLLGSEKLPARASLCALLTFGKSFCGLTPDQDAILFDIRLPRILLGAAVGGSLAIAGASYQSLLRNPLAEPYLLGISNGAAVGTMVALVFMGAHEWSRPLMAFCGALIANASHMPAGSRAGTDSCEPTPYDRPSFWRMRSASRLRSAPPPSM